MIIGFDAKRIVRNNTGLGSYSRNLVNDLSSVLDSGTEMRLYAPDEGNEALRRQVRETAFMKFVYPDSCNFRLTRDLWRIKGIVDDLKRDKVDLFHGLTGELPMGIKKAGIKSVVTIHDLIFMHHPEYYNWLDTKIYAWKFHQTCKEADRIIVMEGGRIAQIGTHDELLKTSEIYRETFTSQNKMTEEAQAPALNAADKEGGEVHE